MFNVNPWQMFDISYAGMVNTQMNLGMMDMAYRASIFPCCYSSAPMELLNPGLALGQTFNQWSMNNSCWGNGFGGSFNPWTFGNGAQWYNGGSSSGSGSTGTVEGDTLKKYTDILDKIKMTDTDKKAYEEALKKTDIGERLEAVKEVFKKIDTKSIRDAILKDNTEIEDKVFLLGNDKFLGKKLKKGIPNNFSTDNLISASDKATPFNILAGVLVQDGSGTIIPVLSRWNDSNHNSDSDRNIIRYVANHLDGSNADVDFSKGIEAFVQALLNEADKYSDSNQISIKKSALSDKLAEVNKLFKDGSGNAKTPSKSELKTALLNMAPAFDALYAQIRIQQAQELNKKIMDDYGTEFNSIKEGTIPTDIIIKDTKEDLAREGIEVPEADIIVEEGGESTYKTYDTDKEYVEQNLKAANGSLKAPSQEGCSGYYLSKTLYAPAKRYILNDGKLYEIKGVKSVDHNNFTFEDGTVKTLEEIKNDDSLLEAVSQTEIEQYKKFEDAISQQIKNGNLVGLKSGRKCNGQNIYRSKGKNEKGYYEYYIIVDGELQKLNGYIGTSGKLYAYDKKTVLDNNVEDGIDPSNYSSVGINEVLTSDKTPENDKKETTNTNADKYEKYEVGGDKYEDSHKIGVQINDCLNGGTTISDGKEFLSAFAKVNKYNIKAVIQGYEDDNKGTFWGCGADDICDQIMNENGEEMQYKRLQCIYKIVEYTLDYADDNPNAVPQGSVDELREIYKLLKYTLYDDGDTSKPIKTDLRLNCPPQNCAKMEEDDFNDWTEQIKKLRKKGDTDSTDDDCFEKIDDLVYDILGIDNH